jgi:STE24 endopeptidase
MEENLKQSKQYSKLKVSITIIQLILTIAFFLIMLVLGVSAFLADAVKSWTGNFYLQVSLYLIIFTGMYYLIFLPLDFYDSFLLEHRFHLSNETFAGWAIKNLKKALVSVPVLLIAGESLYFLLRYFPHSWWLLLAVLWLLFTVILNKIVPVLIIPLFYKCTPLPDGSLRNKLIDLADKCGLVIKGVFEIKLSKDTKKANAAVAGYGKGRRILLGDTLLGNYSEDEINAVFAHELGHVKLFHTWKILGFGMVVSLVCFYLTYLFFKAATGLFGFDHIYNIAAFPLLPLFLMLVGLVLLPVQNGYMRHLEKGADMFALDHIQDKQNFISAIAKLGAQNLSDPSPGKFVELFLYTHPPISKRLHYAGKSSAF